MRVGLNKSDPYRTQFIGRLRADPHAAQSFARAVPNSNRWPRWSHSGTFRWAWQTRRPFCVSQKRNWRPC